MVLADGQGGHKLANTKRLRDGLDMTKVFRLPPVALLVLPLMWVGVVVYNQVTFYPFTKEIIIYSHEVMILYLSFAPFVFALPKHSLGLVTNATRMYRWGFFLIILVSGLVTLLMIFSGR
jgi:hypothetical protein